jgi:hypothetical protein
MYMAARVRLFCVPGPKGSGDGDISFRYLSAFHRGGIGVRAIPLGGIDLSALSGSQENGVVQFSPWAHWERLAECFVEPIAAGYVNVVCCPPATLYGAKRTMKEASGGMSDSDELASSSGMALVELLTASVKNIAITSFSNKPTPGELVALREYDRVICHNKDDVALFRDAGVEAFHLSPNDLVSTWNLWTGLAAT